MNISKISRNYFALLVLLPPFDALQSSSFNSLYKSSSLETKRDQAAIILVGANVTNVKYNTEKDTPTAIGCGRVLVYLIGEADCIPCRAGGTALCVFTSNSASHSDGAASVCVRESQILKAPLVHLAHTSQSMSALAVFGLQQHSNQRH